MTSIDLRESRSLGASLKDLRQQHSVTQKQVTEALNVSMALLSSWENDQAVPPDDRLRTLGRFFATRRTATHGAELVAEDDLTMEEERDYRRLVEALFRRRDADAVAELPDGGMLGGRFWFLPGSKEVTVLATPLSRAQFGVGDGAIAWSALSPAQRYALNDAHPNAVHNFRNGDIDALLELVGHIRAENPGADVTWMTYDQAIDGDSLVGDIVLLGGGDSLYAQSGTQAVDELVRLLELPVRFLEEPNGDEEFDLQFAVTEDEEGLPVVGGERLETYQPRWRRNERDPDRPRLIRNDAPQLEYDIALIARKPNPWNRAATVTMCAGLFSRGTYGAVRAFTDAKLRAQNEDFLYAKADPEDCWMLVQVPVFGGRTITPDLASPVQRLRTSWAGKG